jgi:uncharacterized protein YdeI (YjbR/CyaY-like superfamily)
MVRAKDGLEILLFESAPDWYNWLKEHGSQTEGVWLLHAKKASGKKSVSYAEALNEALCFGWIDSQKQSYDELYYKQKYTPRRAKSVWSKVNVAKAEEFIKAGKMQPSGFAAIEMAKTNGEWARAYDSSTTMATPKDFQAALNKNSRAKKFYLTLNKTNTYAFCWRVQTAKKPETRKARIEKFVSMLERGEKLY